MKAKEYLSLIGIEITNDVEKEIKDSYDLDCVMDGSYLYDTDYIDINTFRMAQEYVHNYFNGNAPDHQDLSMSLTAQYSHYLPEEVEDGMDVVKVELENEIVYYEK